MANKAVRVFVDRVELIGYTSLTLTRDKQDMTGSVEISVFMGWLPEEPPMANATAGRELLIYVGNHLAFTGVIDTRTDQSINSKSGTLGSSSVEVSSGRNLSIGPDSYSVTFSCRGKTKYIIDSSHQHPEGTILRPTSRSAFEEIIGPFGVELQWEAEEVDLDKVVLRDGGHVSDELQRIAEQCSLFVHETRDGKLKVTDGTQEFAQGEAIVLGTNILDFSTSQSEAPTRNQIVVKGQLSSKGEWGVTAVLPTVVKSVEEAVQAFSPINVQVYGNAAPSILEKRAIYEANKRNAQAKQVDVDVFHVTQADGSPWDIGVVHYVEIPPAGVFSAMEVTKLTYTVEPDGPLKTSLTLSPTPLAASVANADSFLGSIPDISSISSMASSRSSLLGGGNLNIWEGAALSQAELFVNSLTGVISLLTDTSSAGDDFLGAVTSAASAPALELPAGYKSEDE